jgi:hypothetical protein
VSSAACGNPFVGQFRLNVRQRDDDAVDGVLECEAGLDADDERSTNAASIAGPPNVRDFGR